MKIIVRVKILSENCIATKHHINTLFSFSNYKRMLYHIRILRTKKKMVLILSFVNKVKYCG